jgi:hypothetical protein
MNAPSFSLVVNHTPWNPDRVKACASMLRELLPYSGKIPFFLHDTDYRDTEWQDEGKVRWALAQWRWSAFQDVSHHVFMTDDLHIFPDGFWKTLAEMIGQKPDVPIGLLSNHPKAPELYIEGYSWYRTNSWLVGPAYVMPHKLLVEFLVDFEKKPWGSHKTVGTQQWANDDSSINEWITRSGRECWHPIPTIIEHRDDVASTTWHGDKYSRERVSWREVRDCLTREDGSLEWITAERRARTPIGLKGPELAPLLSLPSS